jgi:hypothetical protein
VQATLEPVRPNVFKTFRIVITLNIECRANRAIQVTLAIQPLSPKNPESASQTSLSHISPMKRAVSGNQHSISDPSRRAGHRTRRFANPRRS